jgi:hypothetical protein
VQSPFRRSGDARNDNWCSGESRWRWDRDDPVLQAIGAGYALRIPAPDALLGAIADHLAFKRHCCPFITFELDFAPNQGPLSLGMRGPAAFKEFLREGFETDLGIDAAVASDFQAH